MNERLQMSADALLKKAVRLLADAASPSKIILFGSRARGCAAANSDFDFVVLEREVKDRRAETVRLLRVLEPHGIPADVLVASEEFYEQWKGVPGTVLYEVNKEGKVVYEAA